jgi:hypothetical protein
MNVVVGRQVKYEEFYKPLQKNIRTNILEGRLLGRVGKFLLKQKHFSGPVPINDLASMRRLLYVEDGLYPQQGELSAMGNALRNSFLANKLADVELGRWSLTVPVLNFLEREISRVKPKMVLEFGSGVSTACLARYMFELYGDLDATYIVSIEDKIEFLEKTKEFLDIIHVAKYAKVIHLPLRFQIIEGIRSNCYDLSMDSFAASLGTCQPELVVIDGPALKGGRVGTLPLALPFLSEGAWFFLDDALRDEELECGRVWSKLPYVQVYGVHLIGAGLLVGRVIKRVKKVSDHECKSWSSC